MSIQQEERSGLKLTRVHCDKAPSTSECTLMEPKAFNHLTYGYNTCNVEEQNYEPSAMDRKRQRGQRVGVRAIE